MDEQQGLATRPSLGQPGLDVEPPLRAARSRPCGRDGRWAACARACDRRRSGRSSGGSLALPLVRVEDEAGQGLGVEVGRLLGHHVAVPGHGEDARRRASARAGTRRRRRPPPTPRRRPPRPRTSYRRSARRPRPQPRRCPAARRARSPAATRRARRTAAPPGATSGANAARLASSSHAPSRVTSPNRPSPPRIPPAASNRSTSASGVDGVTVNSAVEAGRRRRSSPTSPSPRTSRCVGRTVSASAASRNSMSRKSNAGSASAGWLTRRSSRYLTDVSYRWWPSAMNTGPAAAAATRRSAGPSPSASAGTTHRRWRTPSSSTRSATGAPDGHHRERRRRHARRVLVQPHHRRGVEAGRPQQAVAVLLRTRQGPLVRQHRRSRPERLDAEPREEPALRAHDGGARDPVGLLVDVDRRARVLAQGPVRSPGGQRCARRAGSARRDPRRGRRPEDRGEPRCASGAPAASRGARAR